MIRITILQQVPYEGPGAIIPWAEERGATITLLSPSMDPLPMLDSFDLLVILGGPMSVHDNLDWLEAEKKLIVEAIEAQKSLLGICLGAQLIAVALGGAVIASPEKEIGVYPLKNCTPAGHTNTFISTIPPTFQALHWHGEMCTIPQGATLFASSDGCPHQGFVYGDRVVALQYHLEVTPASLEELIAHSKEELEQGGRFIQDLSEMREKVAGGRKKIQGQLYVILDTLLGRILTR